MVAVAPVIPDLELVDPFVRAVREVFRTMLGSGSNPGPILPVKHGHRMFALTGVIGLSGRLQGAISISVPEAVGLAMLNRMTGIDATDVDDFVRDAIGEIANMVAGLGKKDLADLSLQLGLPQVIVGADYCVYSPRWARHYWLSLETDLGPCHLDVGFDRSHV